MKLEKFEEKLDYLFNNIERKKVTNNTHLASRNRLSNGMTLAEDRVVSQYIGLINQPVKIYLGTLNSKLRNLEPINTEDKQLRRDGLRLVRDIGERIDPEEHLDKIIRYCELKRDKPIFAYVDKNTNQVFGAVSDRHPYIPDKKIYEDVRKFCTDLGEKWKVDADYNYFTMDLNIDFPEITMEIENNDDMNYRISIKNNQFGHGSLRISGGFLRLVCTNGLVIMDDNINQRIIHNTSEKNFVSKYLSALVKTIDNMSESHELIQKAMETQEQLIDEQKTSFLEFLPKNYDIKVKEAKEIMRFIKTDPKYKNTGFWVGQATAEVANRQNLEDRIRLQEEAGKLVLATIKG